MPFVYILKCPDDSYYVGSARNLEVRIDEHHRGQGAAYTRRRLPIALVFAQEYERVDDAYFVEKKIQGWGRTKREALIRGDLDLLPNLSRRPSSKWRR